MGNIRIRFVGKGESSIIKTRIEHCLRQEGHLLTTVGRWIDMLMEVCEFCEGVYVTLHLDARNHQFIATIQAVEV